MNAINQTAAQIRDALDTMEAPHWCRNCLEYYDANSRECDLCGSDETEDTDDLLYHLDIAEEQETRGAA